ncbi:MAG: xanthine dehydrogenase accessory protein XdhC [Caulobacter sp.]|nr:xanthine dehydrogenase accessory protein XdhC [Caulobacter sp.]
MTWASEALAAVRKGEPVALVSVVSAEGSTPREAGARMLVTPGRQSGTIGGGNLEHLATDQARKLLAQSARTYALQDYPLGPLLSQCCGGYVRLLLERLDDASAPWLEAVDAAYARRRPFGIAALFKGDQLERVLLRQEDQWVGRVAPAVLANGAGHPLAGKRPRPGEGDQLIERIDAAKPTVLLFGAGHVGQAIARAFAPLPFTLDQRDSREEAGGPGVSVQDEAALVEAAGSAGPDDYVLVLTHNHDLDYRLVRAAMGAKPRYLGMIGSATKRARFERRLRDDGFSEGDLADLTCPIGIPGLKSKAPEIIAVAVAADLLQRLEDFKNAG